MPTTTRLCPQTVTLTPGIYVIHRGDLGTSKQRSTDSSSDPDYANDTAC